MRVFLSARWHRHSTLTWAVECRRLRTKLSVLRRGAEMRSEPSQASDRERGKVLGKHQRRFFLETVRCFEITLDEQFREYHGIVETGGGNLEGR